jgi:hypothetical protein
LLGSGFAVFWACGPLDYTRLRGYCVLLFWHTTHYTWYHLAFSYAQNKKEENQMSNGKWKLKKKWKVEIHPKSGSGNGGALFVAFLFFCAFALLAHSQAKPSASVSALKAKVQTGARRSSNM